MNVEYTDILRGKVLRRHAFVICTPDRAIGIRVHDDCSSVPEIGTDENNMVEVSWDRFYIVLRDTLNMMTLREPE